MGLVDLSLVSQEPSYWGWLKPLLLEDLELAIVLCDPERTAEQAKNPESAEDILKRILGALKFTDAPSLLGHLSGILEKPASPEHFLEALLAWREEVLTFGGNLSLETAQAVGQALQEEILTVSASLEALAAGGDFKTTFLEVAGGLEERQKAMEFLELATSATLIGTAVTRLISLSERPSIDREDLLQAIEPLAQLEPALADALFHGEEFLSSGLSPSTAKEILRAISTPLQEEISSLRHLLLETPSHESQDHLKPGLEKMAGVFYMLGQEPASHHLTGLANSLDRQSAREEIAMALAQAEILVLGLLTRYPNRLEWQPPKEASVAPVRQETNPIWEQAALLIERWARKSHPEDAVATIRALKSLDGIPPQAQGLSGSTQKILEACFSSIQAPGVPERAGVIQAFRALHRIRFHQDVTPEQIAQLQGRLDLLLSPKPTAEIAPAALSLFDWEASLDPGVRESFWSFSMANLGALKKPETTQFWIALGWMEASVSMLAGETHPLRKTLEETRASRTISADSLVFLEWVLEGTREFRKNQLANVLGLMEVYIGAAKETMAAGNFVNACNLLSEQSKLLSEHGFSTGDL